LAYALLGVLTFIVLAASFYKLGLCEGSEPLCVYIALGGAALGSVLLLLLAASGGLAVAFCAIHGAVTASIYTLALKARKSTTQAPLALSRLENACLRGDVPSAIRELRELSLTLERASVGKRVKEEVDVLLEELEYHWGVGRYEEARKILRKIAERVKAWEAML
jgi:hypothetical protein